ncbi:MAG: protease pro-enzyme activation domain-containing protein, partial [Verrucomicrobiota bacterium]
SAVSLGAIAGLKRLPGQMPAVLSQLVPDGIVPASNRLQLSIGLPLHHQDQLGELIAQLYDPHSTNYHKFLKPDEFTARFGPTEGEYDSVVQFAEAHGLTVVRRHSNRVVLDVAGSAVDIGHAFKITLHTYKHPTERRDFFAPDTEPSVPTNLPMADIWGLSDYARPKPQLVKVDASSAKPQNYNGTGEYGSYQGSDFRNAYIPGSSLNGGGQTVALVELDGYYSNDITSYEEQCGYPNVPVQNVLLDGVAGNPGYSGITEAVVEVSLDIEMTIAMAPGLSNVVVYEGNNPYDIFNAIATDDTANQIASAWTFDTDPNTEWAGTGTTLDSILSEMVSQGQSFFQASGDSAAYTGSDALNPHSAGPIPVDSIYVTSVGGISLTMNGSGGSWSSETVWNWGNNQGSGGGVSFNYSIPQWQTNVDMSANHGSTSYRNLPDVALTADAVDVVYSNGLTGIFGGTSCAAPLWAGFCALINQQAVGSGEKEAGFLNPALYAIGTGPNYTACFHDTTTGNNIGDNKPGRYYATSGYDLCTGWGTPNGTNLVNALAPLGSPFFISQPASQNAISGTGVTITAPASGAAPLRFQWLLDGTNLSDGGNISGSGTDILNIAAATTNSAGNYSLVVSNAYGSITSLVASLTVNLRLISGTLSSSENPSGFRDLVDFAVDVAPTNASGTIQFFTNGTAFELETLIYGQTNSANLASLPRGTNIIAAVYSGDANDLPFTNLIYQVVTNHPPTAIPAFFTRAAGAVLNIPVTNLAAGWSDVDGDIVSLAGISVSTNGVTVTNNAGLLTYYDSNNVADQFTCTITDGFGGTNYQTVNIVVAFPAIGVVPGGGIALNLTGAPGQTYVLETTTNLISPMTWLPVATNTLGTNGIWQFTDPQAANFAQRFYRLKFW